MSQTNDFAYQTRLHPEHIKYQDAPGGQEPRQRATGRGASILMMLSITTMRMTYTKSSRK